MYKQSWKLISASQQYIESCDVIFPLATVSMIILFHDIWEHSNRIDCLGDKSIKNVINRLRHCNFSSRSLNISRLLKAGHHLSRPIIPSLYSNSHDDRYLIRWFRFALRRWEVYPQYLDHRSAQSMLIKPVDEDLIFPWFGLGLIRTRKLGFAQKWLQECPKWEFPTGGKCSGLDSESYSSPDGKVWSLFRVICIWTRWARAWANNFNMKTFEKKIPKQRVYHRLGSEMKVWRLLRTRASRIRNESVTSPQDSGESNSNLTEINNIDQPEVTSPELTMRDPFWTSDEWRLGSFKQQQSKNSWSQIFILLLIL